MARQQAADYDQKRELITNAAAVLFAQKGFDGASVSDIAAACKTSKSLIYHYYKSKEAILFDVMNGHIDSLLNVIAGITAQPGAPRERFAALSRELLRRYVGAASHQKVLLYELNNLPSSDRKEIIAKQRKIIDFAETLLSDSASISLDHAKLRGHVMLFFGMLNWTHNWFKPSGAMSRDELADLAASTTLNALNI